MYCRSSSFLFSFTHHATKNVLPTVKRCCSPVIKSVPQGQRTYYLWNSYHKRKLLDYGSTLNINPKFVRYRNSPLRNQSKQNKSQAPNESNLKTRTLWSPIAFTLLVGNGSFACVAIYLCETRFNPHGSLSKLSRATQSFMREIPLLRQLLSMEISTGRKVVAGVVLTNILVFACWRIKAFQSTMTKYFLNSAEKSTKVSSMLFSTFSHVHLIHLFVNMYVLWSFSVPLASLFSPGELTAFYLTSGVVASLAGMAYKIMIKSPTPSLGASGAILAVIGAIGCTMPNERVQIALIGEIYPHSFSISTGIKGIIALDVLGLLLGWKLFDHAAHLGGILFGLWYAKHGRELFRYFLSYYLDRKILGKKR